MLKPKYKVGQRVWYTDNITKHRVMIVEIWWGGKYGDRNFFIPKFAEGQAVKLKCAPGADPITIETVYNFKNSWECDRSDMEHGGSIVYYNEPRYACEGWMNGTFCQFELEATDDTKPTEKDIHYDILFSDGCYKIVRQTELRDTSDA